VKNNGVSKKNIECEIFKALEHQLRRDIIRLVGEKKNPTFTDIMQAAKITDSPTLSYHLRTLALFIEQQNGNYQLTPIGQDAYSLLLKTATYDKRFFHMGMNITEEEDRKWHQEHHEMTPEIHKALMEKMGINDEEEDKEWHRMHEGSSQNTNTSEKKAVNPFAVGGGFLDYCVRQGWLIKQGEGRHAQYFVTKTGEEQMNKQYNIKI
jgi:predicted transcriptional regulator